MKDMPEYSVIPLFGQVTGGLNGNCLLYTSTYHYYLIQHLSVFLQDNADGFRAVDFHILVQIADKRDFIKAFGGKKAAWRALEHFTIDSIHRSDLPDA